MYEQFRENSSWALQTLQFYFYFFAQPKSRTRVGICIHSPSAVKTFTMSWDDAAGRGRVFYESESIEGNYIILPLGYPFLRCRRLSSLFYLHFSAFP